MRWDSAKQRCHRPRRSPRLWRLVVRRGVRRGFTLLELMIALLLADVVLLALVGTMALVTRELTQARARRAAVNVARARLERLASTNCADAEHGDSVSGPGLHEWWSASAATSATRLLTDSVALAMPRGPRAIVLLRRAPC